MAELKKDIDKITKDWAKRTENKIRKELSWTTDLKNNVKIIVNSKGISLEMPEYGIYVDKGTKNHPHPRPFIYIFTEALDELSSLIGDAMVDNVIDVGN